MLPPLDWQTFPQVLELLSGLELPASALEQLKHYWQLLERKNASLNLTRIEGVAEFLEKHALDALLALPALDAVTRDVERPLVIDVGAGGGVPSIPLAIARPGWRVVAVEATGKKASFLREVATKLKLDLDVRAERAEAVGHSPLRGKGQAVVARAVGPAATCLELCLPLTREGGATVLYRGPSLAGESETLTEVATLLGGEEPVVHDLLLPSGAERRLVVVTKAGPTSGRYPRRNGVPAKRPLPS